MKKAIAKSLPSWVKMYTDKEKIRAYNAKFTLNELAPIILENHLCVITGNTIRSKMNLRSIQLLSPHDKVSINITVLLHM